MDGLFNGKLVEMPAILAGLFHKVVNTTSSPIGVEGGGSGSHEVAGPSDSRKFIWTNDINPGCFWLHKSENVSTSMPSLTSQSCVDSLPAVCRAGQVGAIYRSPEH